jgi:hypothetical protein
MMLERAKTLTAGEQLKSTSPFLRGSVIRFLSYLPCQADDSFAVQIADGFVIGDADGFPILKVKFKYRERKFSAQHFE